MDFTIRAVRPEEHEEVGELTARAYLDDGHLTFGEDDPYLPVMKDVARRAVEAEVLVAADAEGALLGAVTFTPGGGEWADIAGADEAEFRLLAVARGARGRGVGEALVRACVDRARTLDGCVRVVLSTQDRMTSAHRIYRRLGFVRVPERDWSPVPGLSPLWAFSLDV
ncbi:GNAT family N-acetyltransferase [Streptomyces filamentosus]|uniref:GNAT family N-acetyltransferase n=1 Tax=Streptomyces filamentosus TaxID=67294 RepID=UPI001239B4EE|nr:GNAT family N-acetyltransferase [Streptomyces filamentosus]KAA6219609.1 GNAT family N-acetyltransferase [Streptomyces filamentosus]